MSQTYLTTKALSKLLSSIWTHIKVSIRRYRLPNRLPTVARREMGSDRNGAGSQETVISHSLRPASSHLEFGSFS